jgi:hypothetical protein
METYARIFYRRCLVIASALATALAAGDCLAVIAFRLPEVQVNANPSGPTTGTFNVTVTADAGDLPKNIGAFNLDFSVGSNMVTLAPPAGTAASLIPTVNPLLADPGPVDSPFIVSPFVNNQTIRVAHDVPTDRDLMATKNLVTVSFSVPQGTTGTFPLSFGAVQNNVLVQGGTATPLPLNLVDVGQITIMPAGPVGVPGDYNSNGVVDAADYVFWRERLGSSTALPNEVAGVTPGMVTNEDYTAWRARFGRTSGAGAALGASAAVPEPSTWIGAGVLLVFFLAGSRAVCRQSAACPAVALTAAGANHRSTRQNGNA